MFYTYFIDVCSSWWWLIRIKIWWRCYIWNIKCNLSLRCSAFSWLLQDSSYWNIMGLCQLPVSMAVQTFQCQTWQLLLYFCIHDPNLSGGGDLHNVSTVHVYWEVHKFQFFSFHLCFICLHLTFLCIMHILLNCKLSFLIQISRSTG